MKSHFYYKTIWSHVVGFADLFNDMEVFTYDRGGNPVGRKRVPLYLAPKEKVVSILQVQPGNQRPEIDNTLPRMSIAWNGIQLDPERLRDQSNIRRLWVEYIDSDQNQLKNVVVDVQTVPYKMTFELTLWVKFMDHGVQLLENILPFFAPDLHVSLFERGIGIERKSKVELTGVTNNFAYDLNEPDRRVLQWNLNFDMECNLYKPLQVTKDIRAVITRVYATNPNNPYFAQGFQSTTAVTSGWETPTRLDDRILEIISDFEDFDERYLEQYNHMIQRGTRYDPLNPSECILPTKEGEEQVKQWKDGNIDLAQQGYTKVIHEFDESVLGKPYFIVDGDGNVIQNWTDEEIGNVTTEDGKVRPFGETIVNTYNGLVFLNPNPYTELGITNFWEEELPQIDDEDPPIVDPECK